MTAVTEEPALRFWLRYAELQGALVERHPDQALLVLPPSLQAASELPEEVAVTAHPDVAREDGAVLLIAGHPALERAATAVLAEGDTGHAYLPWPGSRPPARSTLEARARELVAVEHGRIDAAGEPAPAYVPLLRVGVMINYSASLALRLGEQDEAWVDARTGLPLPERMLAALRDASTLREPEQRHRTLALDLSLALPAAHMQLEQRASARQASLGVHARRALESELARADGYYQGALESIERRRSKADGDRVRLLEAQADATRAEHTRRKREIEHEHRARHEIKPFRLHLVHAPAYVLRVQVRRGDRTFPFALTWLVSSNEFAAFRCPACGAAETLVAGRDGLGCESCKSRSAARGRAPGIAAAELPAPRSRDRPASRPPSVIEDRAVKQRAPTDSDRRSARTRNPPRPAAPPRSRPSAAGRGNVERTGNKLAVTFWQHLTRGDRWPRKKAARDSPLRALYRLYGQAGPLCALGIARDGLPSEVTASTLPGEPGTPELTVGDVLADGEWYRYSLSWQLELGKPAVYEVMPAPHPLALPPLHGETAEIGARLRGSAPAPTAQLDPVAAALWNRERERHGLPFAVRCLATWWRVQKAADRDEPPGAFAAAVAAAVARAAGMRRARAETAAIYQIPVADVQRAAASLGGALRLDRARGW
ncbi:MAG: hypothetical protein ACRDPC_15705 [Solirubrobacteraceae bacterium]